MTLEGGGSVGHVKWYTVEVVKLVSSHRHNFFNVSRVDETFPIAGSNGKYGKMPTALEVDHGIVQTW